MLELIRRLAEDDKEGVMAHKVRCMIYAKLKPCGFTEWMFTGVLLQVLGLLWNLAHKDDVPTDIMDQALNAHIKILDYSCSQV